jgi:hypothetical protein
LDDALALAVRFLLEQQSPDGAWRSDTYGAFKDGFSLTPLALHSLLACGGSESGSRKSVSALEKGGVFLASAVERDGTIVPGPLGLSYPVYTASLSVRVLGVLGDEGLGRARSAWLAYLRNHQLTEPLGWTPGDRAYGGWGYSQGVPVKPPAGQPAAPFTESNLSATVFAVEALRSAGAGREDPALQRACQFICSCQNYAADPVLCQPEFDDGGFFFIYDDALRNKAGVAGRDRTGRERYSSYGSMTADGVRGLLACGLPLDDARVAAGRLWLSRHFSAANHPGAFAVGREAVRASVYFYYCWSLAQTLTLCGQEATPAKPLTWSEKLAEALIERQQPQGFWVNDAVEVREDDSLLSTALAAGAAAMCRAAVIGGPSRSRL